MISFTIEAMLKLIERLKTWFSLDTRSLALARMGFGLSIFIDLLYRMTSIEWHYTDLGIMPRDVFISNFSYPWTFSFHFASGTFAFALIMLLAHAFFALCLMIGFRTRLMTFLIALMTISLHNRMWYLNNGGDDTLRVLMILAIFIPWGEMWSVDWWRSGHSSGPRKVSGAWVVTWFFQAFAIYFVSYILKTSPIWRSEYTAIYYASHLDIFATDIGRFLRQFPTLMKINTFFAILLEWLGPLTLAAGWMMPRKFWWLIKIIIVAAFWGLHLGIIMTMSIGLFPFYCLCMWATFIPSGIWDKLQDKWPRFVMVLNRPFEKISNVLGLETSRGREFKFLFWVSQGLAVFVFLTIFFWNLSTLKPPLKVSIPFWVNTGRILHLYQEWNMFAPFPKRENLWLEVPAELEDGSSIELLTMEKDVHTSKRDSFPKSIPNEHWRKYFMNISDNQKLAEQYGGAWCRIWNRDVRNGGIRPRLRRFSINVFHHVILPDYQESPQVKKTVWNHWCFEQDLKKENAQTDK
jgi:hypothetical protein